MPVTNEEAARIARAYGMTLTDAATLITMAADVPEAKHIAIQFAGTDAERADEAYTLEREQHEADQAVENKEFEAYQAAHPKPSVVAWKPVEPEYRDGMTSGERQKAFEGAHEANVRGEAAELSDATQQRSRDYYAWAAAGKPEK